MLTQESPVGGGLPTPIPNMANHVMAEGFEMLRDMSVGDDSSNNGFQQVKEKRDPCWKK